MQYGTIFYDPDIGRMNISFQDGGYGDGFHCGEVIEVYNKNNGFWEPQRIEYDHSYGQWYFVGEAANIEIGIQIRIR